MYQVAGNNRKEEASLAACRAPHIARPRKTPRGAEGIKTKGEGGRGGSRMFPCGGFDRANFSPKNSRGFTLLFAVLIGGLLFSLGVAVAQIALREIVLSSSGKSSEAAFYASDAGVECALYWDFQASGVFPNTLAAPRPRTSITCAGTAVPLVFFSGTDKAATTTFTLPLLSVCADVVVGKVAPAGGAPERTLIESRGRNNCGTDVNPGRVERALRVRY